MISSDPLRFERPTADEAVPAPVEAAPTAAALLSRTAALRYQISHQHAEAIQLDRFVHQLGVEERATAYTRQDVPSLLRLLTTTWGMSWASVAKIVGVSVQAIRNWRAGEPASPENRWKCALAVALLETLSDQLMIEDPASWLEIPLGGTPLTAADLVAAGRLDLVMDYAASRIPTADRLLSLFDPDWRARYHRRFEIFEGSDGEPAIRIRER